jgi:molybdopterin converting factor small subunit
MSLGIQFQIPKMLQEKTNGEGLVEVEGASVHECIADLIRRHQGLKGLILDGENRILLKWLVYINDKSAISSGELYYRVKDGDKIALLPMVAGG